MIDSQIVGLVWADGSEYIRYVTVIEKAVK